MIDDKKLIEKQITELNTLSKIYESKPLGRFLNEVANTIFGLFSKLQETNYGGEWIPCSERLPEWGTTSYLVCLKNGGIFMAIFLNDGEFKEISTLGTREFSKDNPVIAWQPLPDAYIVKNREEEKNE